MATPLHPGGFTPDQIAELTAPLDRAKVKQRSQSGRSLSYLEGWQVIAEANRIFGFDGWQRETINVQCVSERERAIGRDQKAGWGVTYTCRVRITVGHSMGAVVIREGTGAGHGIDVDCGLAHESAIKEAETDAMKRALMTFGNPFGLALYDKDQREVKSTDELTADELQRQAMSVAKSAGLTGTGMKALFAAIAPEGATGWGQIPAATLHRLIKAGVSQESVDRYNAAGEEPEEQPGSWDLPVANRADLAAMAAQAA
jgi:DNA recombination protein Rad52